MTTSTPDISKGQYRAIQHAIDNTCDPTISARCNYSGRGMYGETCLGITGRGIDAYDVHNILMDAFMDDEVIVNNIMDRRAEDQMGLGTIIYFPGITVEKPDDVEDDDHSR
jgi:hypothetical protein